MLIISAILALVTAEPTLTNAATPAAVDYPKGECILQECPPGTGCDIVVGEDVTALCVATCEKPDGSDYLPVVISNTERPVIGSYDDWCERRANDFCDAFGAFLDNWCWGQEA